MQDPRTLASGLAAALAEHGLRLAALYGSGARDGFDPDRSDVNLLLVFDALDAGRLAALAGPLQLARAGWRCAPFVLTAEELARMAVEYPIKLYGIRRHYQVLAGADLLAGLVPTRTALGAEAVRVLRNAALKLRRAELQARPDPAPVLEALKRFLPQLRDVARLIKDDTGASEDSLVMAERRWGLAEGSLQAAFALRRRPAATWPEVDAALRTAEAALAAALAEAGGW